LGWSCGGLEQTVIMPQLDESRGHGSVIAISNQTCLFDLGG
jgi:hypothetical protein